MKNASRRSCGHTKSYNAIKAPTCAGGKGCGACMDKYQDKLFEDSLLAPIKTSPSCHALPDYRGMDDVELQKHVAALLECVDLVADFEVKGIKVVRL